MRDIRTRGHLFAISDRLLVRLLFRHPPVAFAHDRDRRFLPAAERFPGLAPSSISYEGLRFASRTRHNAFPRRSPVHLNRLELPTTPPLGYQTRVGDSAC